MTDDIVEAGARALAKLNGRPTHWKQYIADVEVYAKAVLGAARPMIEAQERERLAKLLEDGVEVVTWGSSARELVGGKPLAEWIRSQVTP